MMLRIQKYSFRVVWRKGKNLIIADTLSRAPQPFTEPSNVEEYEVHSVRNLPISDVRIAEFREETSKDLILQMVQKYVNQGWPDSKNAVPLEVRPFWCVRDELYVSEGLVLRREKLVVPISLRRSMLSKIHASHLGIEKCTARAKDLFYWPGMSAQITEMCEQCSTCAEYRTKQQKEPMIVTQVPDYPWQKVASDLFSFDGESYVLVGDYFSKFVEYTKLSHDTTSASVITFLQEQFARHGIPEQLISDGGPQYDSKEFSAFATKYGFTHIKSSPEYPQSNGFAESQVKILKNILKKAKHSKVDVNLAILEWRNTPVKGLGSPAQLSQGRRLRSTLPSTVNQLRPHPITVNLSDALESKGERAKHFYDKSALPHDLPQLQPGENVRMRTSSGWVPAKVTQKCEEPRSYLVQKGVKIYRPNRRDIRQSSDIDAQSQEPIVPPRIPTKVPVISTPNPVIKTVSTPAPPIPSQEGGESKACKHDTVPVNKPVGVEKPVVKLIAKPVVKLVAKPVVTPTSSSTPVYTRTGIQVKIPSRYT